tara:strand:+ start:5537 stop:6268 length:732 start_codon:yes stop_codon:yes gene_type:complete
MVSPVVLKNDIHAKLKVIESGDYSRHKEEHLVSITAQDFFVLSSEFPLVFVKDNSQDKFIPVAIMGLKEGQNLYCQTEEWKAQVVPASFNHYPFRMIKVKEKDDQLVLVIDEDSPQLSETEGTPLFKEDGEKTEYLEKKIESLLKNAQLTAQTEEICKIFADKGLLTTQQLQLQYRQDTQRYNIDGVYVIDEEKLTALSDEDFIDLRHRALIPLIYAHLCSLQQLRKITEMQYRADMAAVTFS